MSTRHGLGLTVGVIYEHEDGTASYRAPGHWLDSFRVRISDVTGFTETKGGRKSLQNTLHILGVGGELASCDINVGITPKIEAWFRAHPNFGGRHPATTSPAAGVSVADELAKLVTLRDAGALSPHEFETLKARLLQ